MLQAVVGMIIGVLLSVVAWLVIRRLTSFAGQRPQDYADAYPRFDLRKTLDGRMICEGAIFGPTGRMTSTFKADFDVTWTGNTCMMREDFEYSNGDTQSRAWELTLGDGGMFTARAEDVPGVGKGHVQGPAVILQYPIRLPKESGGHVLRAFDCMYAMKNGTIVNRSQFRMYGIKVAELVATIRKLEENT